MPATRAVEFSLLHVCSPGGGGALVLHCRLAFLAAASAMFDQHALLTQTERETQNEAPIHTYYPVPENRVVICQPGIGAHGRPCGARPFDLA